MPRIFFATDIYGSEVCWKKFPNHRPDILRIALRDERKSLKWKMRAQVGDKLPWHELPEEVKRG